MSGGLFNSCVIWHHTVIFEEEALLLDVELKSVHIKSSPHIGIKQSMVEHMLVSVCHGYRVLMEHNFF